jgi:molybdopterin molybdotransferase
MLNVLEARARMLARIAPLGAEDVALERAAGRVLAAPIVADRAQPPFPSSAMDGYAVRSADAPGRLRVIGESAAGRGFDGAVGAGECVRISTGAPVPEGGDAIVIQEDAVRDGDFIQAPATPAGRHIRRRGVDFESGRLLLPAGTPLRFAALTLAAAAGRAALAVSKRPRVTIFSGGDEIALPGSAPGPWQVFDSTRYGVAALIADMGGAPQLTDPLPDHRTAIARAVEAAFDVSDLVLMLGGASVGDHDHARAALADLGLALDVEKISVRPGKPTWFGLARGKPVLGLPGNPASALVTARLFLAPILAAMQGADPDPLTMPTMARLDRDLPANGPREHYLRAATRFDAEGRLHAAPFEDQDSSLMTIAAAADSLIVLRAHEPALQAGGLVPMLTMRATLTP